MNKKEAGSKGGKATVEKYGVEHMREIGKRGYQTTVKKYEVLPWNLAHWIMVRRDTGEKVAEW